MTRVAIFCSGSGSNAEALMQYFHNHSQISIVLVVVNRPDALAQERASRFGIPSLYLSRQMFSNQPEEVLAALLQRDIRFILLAGFLQKIHPFLIDAFPEGILNIHPSLLPDFGGKGMYGTHVHEAVLASGKTETGLTIHKVDSEYDHGKIIFQARCRVEKDDSPSDIATRVLAMEHSFYPVVAEQVILAHQSNTPLISS